MLSSKSPFIVILLMFVIQSLAGCSDDGPLSPGSTSSTNGRWILQSPQPTDRALFSIHFEDENTGWIAGSGIILHTADGGLNWTTQIKNDDESYRDISFSDKNNGWAVGKWNVVRHTSDGGKTWEPTDLPVAPNSVVYWFGTHAAVPDVFAAGSLYGYVYLSTDGGDTWRKLKKEFGEIRSVAVMPN